MVISKMHDLSEFEKGANLWSPNSRSVSHYGGPCLGFESYNYNIKELLKQGKALSNRKKVG